MKIENNKLNHYFLENVKINVVNNIQHFLDFFYDELCETMREGEGGGNGRYRTRTIPIFPEEYANSGSGGAKCGALAATSRSGDDDLAQLINAWPSLPTTIQRGIMEMVEEMRRE